jgi:hypothetical protein
MWMLRPGQVFVNECMMRKPMYFLLAADSDPPEPKGAANRPSSAGRYRE